MKLFGRDELADTFTLLDRIALDALLVVSRKSCCVVKSLPLHARRRTMGYVWIGLSWHRGEIPQNLGESPRPRLMDCLRKTRQNLAAFCQPRPHRVFAFTSSEHFDDLVTHFAINGMRPASLGCREIDLPVATSEHCTHTITNT